MSVWIRCKFLMGTLKVGLDNKARSNIGFEKDVILASRLTQRNTRRCAEHGFSKRNSLSRSIPDVNKKFILIHTKIIFRSGTTSYISVHHTFSGTNKSCSVIFPQWVLIQCSGRMLVHSRNPKIHTKIPIRDYLISCNTLQHTATHCNTLI